MLISLLYSIVFTLSFTYSGLQVAGVGFPILLALLLLASPFLVPRSKTRVVNVRPLRTAGLLYLVFALAFAMALGLSSSLTSDDLRYLLSLLGQLVWFPTVIVAYQHNRVFLQRCLKNAAVISLALILAFWMLAIATTGDVFVIRNTGSNLLAGGHILVPDALGNANLAGRTMLLFLVVSLYFCAGSQSVTSGKFWKLYALVTTLFIALTLSRSVAMGVIILWALFSLSGRNTTVKVFQSITLVLIIFTVATSVPAVSERLDSGIERIAELNQNLAHIRVSANNLSIRGRTWVASLQIIQDSPLAGIGVSNALDTMRIYGAVHYKTGIEQPVWVHGGFLKIALYAGFLGLAPFLVLLTYMLQQYYRVLRDISGNVTKQQNASAIVGYAFVVSLVPVNIGADSFGNSMTWFLLIYLLVNTLRNSPSTIEKRSTNRLRSRKRSQTLANPVPKA